MDGAAIGRRTLLAGAAGTIAATSGCVGELRNLLGRESTQQLSLRIVTAPGADDPYAVGIANQLAENLEAAGVGTLVDLLSPDVLLRDVLVNQNFDIYVGRYPSEGDPDQLRSLLHSKYGEEAGWQNPFGYSNLTIDELLEEQRYLDGSERRDAIHELQREIVREQPFTTVAFPDRIAGYRTDRFKPWPAGGPDQLSDYLRLDRVGETDTVEVLIGDPRITRNRNPIAVEHRSRDNVSDLLYEPLARTLSGLDPTPWLARDIRWYEGDGLSASVTLRDTPWHDGEPVTADDVTFTYEFLTDTSLGELDTPVPTPWYRGRVSLVEDVERLDDHTVRFEFSTTNRAVAGRAFRVPILPEHVWRDRTNGADLAGIDVGGPTTEAVVTSNDEAIGSGPLRFEEATPDEFLLLESFEDHFLHSGDVEGIPDGFVEGLSFERARFTVAPSDDAAVQLLENDQADATVDGLSASVVPRIGRSDAISLTVSRSDEFYHVGYNCRNAPLSDPRFRRILARLLDREHLVADTFGGFADPTETPLKGRWTPSDLTWDETASLSFFGENGELDVEDARNAFRNAGYQYDDDNLVRRGET